MKTTVEQKNEVAGGLKTAAASSSASQSSSYGAKGHGTNSGAHGRMVSSAIIALILFGMANAYLSVSSAVTFDRYKFAFRGWTWWILNDLRTHEDEYNVAMLGSSLMVDAVSGCDANYLNKNLEQTSYHQAEYVNQVLGTTFGGNYKAFNLSLPGLMPSDAYMIVNSMFNLGHKPKVILYGIAPRDFIDSTLQSPLDTETYNYLGRLVDLQAIAPELYKDPQTRFNHWLQRNVFLYGHSLDAQLEATEATQRFVDKVVPQPYTEKPFTYWDRVKLIPSYKKGELYPTAMVTSPIDQKFKLQQFKDNTKDYADRYRKPREEVFALQELFLGRLAALCHDNDVQLVLLNMPLTKKNVELLGDARYAQYLARVGAFARQHDMPFLDLNDLDRYSIEDFHDLVHLNGYGARKFFDQMAIELAKNEKTSKRLKAAGVFQCSSGSRKHLLKD